MRRVVVTFARGSRRLTAIAVRLDANRWQVAGTQLSAPGAWTISVAAERRGLPHALYATPWTVASPSGPLPARRAELSQRPLRPILSALAAGLVGLVLLAAGWRLGARLTLRRPRTA